MCIFSARISSVANTRIFARGMPDGQQFLVYSMQYEAASDLAMILPLPAPPFPAEDAVRFIDLSGYPRFFDDMAKGFPEPASRHQIVAAQPAALTALKVHDVGSFEASFVPHQRDFGRLDGRFRLSDRTWKKLPVYKDYAFAVLKLKPGAVKVHPMSFEFPRRNPGKLFFPTVHIHDGRVEPRASFDHSLYCQTLRPLKDWRISSDEPAEGRPLPAGKFMDIPAAQGIVAGEEAILMRRMLGLQANEDIVLAESN